MKIVYKKHEEEHKRLDSHLGIDPLADGGGQQVLSPYHAMGCNPAMMIDPLGLQGQTGMSSPGNDHFIMPFGYMVEGTYVYLSADRLGTGKSIGMKRLEAYIYNSMMEMAEAKQQKIIEIRFAAALAMVDGYNTALQSLVSSYDIRGMVGSQMRSAYLGEYNNEPNDGGSPQDQQTEQGTDVYFKENPTLTMEKQDWITTCVPSILEYAGQEMKGEGSNRLMIMQYASYTFKIDALKDGVPGNFIEPLVKHYFRTGKFTSYQDAINAGRPVFAAMPLGGGGHAVLIIDYNTG